ncbi:AAA family ATPase [Catenuloplanes sp. NPDC051500]|uniref:AAA family ATPase n=1 Tax=Catenuloplanes sp. NPDC051500 TaxID=3363959 RepID=UPI0037ADB4DA
MPSLGFRSDLSQAFRARIPILYVESYEEHRALAEIAAVARDPELVRTPRALLTWSPTSGLIQPDGTARRGAVDPEDAIVAALRTEEPSVFVFCDLHATLGPAVVRLLRDVAAAFRAGPVPRTLVILAPALHIPHDLEKDVSILDFPLPAETDIRALLDRMIDDNVATGRITVTLTPGDRERFAKAALGLTLHEAENAFARAMVDDQVLAPGDLAVVHEEKRQAVRKSGLLEFVEPHAGLADVGGLENLKRWLVRRDGTWLDEAAAWGLPAPRGVLITGVPGCGKSLTAKAVSAGWGLPLLRLDMGRVFSGLVGSSEQNMRTAIRAAEATSPCVLWIDEIEKGLAASSGSGDNTGTGARVFGTFLTWLQEKTRPVFVIATANDIDRLPAELLRKGRFDEIFFVDLPTGPERTAIWTVHLSRRLSHPAVAGRLDLTPDLLAELTKLTDGYSGAEIEQGVVAALYDAFAERRPLQRDDLVRAVTNTVPLSVTQAERIAGIRTWAASRAVAATAPEDWDMGAGTGRAVEF